MIEPQPIPYDDNDDAHFYDSSGYAEDECWQCGGEGWGIIGLDFPVREPGWDIEGESVRCPCCGGSGDAKDCTYW